MDYQFKDDDQLLLAPGEIVNDLAQGAIWRLQMGAVVLEGEGTDSGTVTPIGLAVPGDLIGVEWLLSSDTTLRARALTASVLQREAHDGAPGRLALLSQSIAQSRRQCADIVRLRSGSATDRVKQLLLLLSGVLPNGTKGANGANGIVADICELPPLREMAALTDSAPETISRVIGNLRRLMVLRDKLPSSVRVDRAALGQLKAPAGMTEGYVCVNRGAMAVMS